MGTISTLMQLCCLGFLWANMSTLPAPSCGRIVKPLYFLLKNYSPGGCWRPVFAFQKVVLKLQFVLVCISEHCSCWICSCQ